jgi:hypothetical protein
VLSGSGLCDELITRPEESYRLWCVVVCDLETSRIGAPYIYDVSSLRVKSDKRRFKENNNFLRSLRLAKKLCWMCTVLGNLGVDLHVVEKRGHIQAAAS